MEHPIQMISRCVLIALLLLAAPSWADIAVDSVSSSQGTSSSSHNHTVGSDANIAVVCVAGREAGGVAVNYSSVTVGGQAATRLDQNIVSGVMISELWYKLSPLTGSQTVAVTGDASTDYTVTGVISLIGAAQSNTFNTVGKAGTVSTSMDIPSLASAVGELGILCGAVRTPTGADPTVTADATAPVSTELYETVHATDNAILGVGYTEPGAVTSIDMRTDLSQSVQWAAVAVSMRPAAPSSRGSSMMLMGIGQ